MSVKKLFKSSMKMVCKGVFKLNFILCNLPLFLRRFLMHTNAIIRMVQESQPCPQQNKFNHHPNCFNNNNRYNPQLYNTPRTSNFTPPHNFNAPPNTRRTCTNLNPHRPQTHTSCLQSQSTTTTRRCSHKHTTCIQSLSHHLPQLPPFWAHNGKLSPYS